jgi:hypothetical protein
VKNRVSFQNLTNVLQCTPSPYLHTAAYTFSIVQSSAAGHQLTPCSAGLPFLISPHLQTENEFLSTHFSVWGTSKSNTGIYPVNGGGGVFNHLNELIGYNLLHREGVVSWRIVSMQNPRFLLTQFRPFLRTLSRALVRTSK